MPNRAETLKASREQYLDFEGIDGNIVEGCRVTEPTQTGWRFLTRPVGNSIYAMASAVLAMIAISPFYSALRPRSVLLIFIGFCVAFYFVWSWVFYERPAELEKKLPITSKELRRRKKDFYDSLPR